MSRLWHHSAVCLLITGKKGSGKSTLWLKLIQEFQRKGYRIFVFDHKLEVSHKLGWKAQVTIEQMKATALAGKPVVFYPGIMYPANRRAAFDDFCRWVFEVSSVLPGKKILAIDEVQQWTELGRDGVPESFQLILDDGRLRGLDLLLISQTPNKVNDAIRAQVTEVYCFKHTDKLVLKWLEEDPFCLDAAEVSSLQKPGGWVYRNCDTDEMKRSGANASDTTRKAGTRPNVAGRKA